MTVLSGFHLLAIVILFILPAVATVLIAGTLNPEVQPALARFAHGIVRLSLRVLPPGELRQRYEEECCHDVDKYLAAGRGLSGVVTSLRIACGAIRLGRVFAAAGSEPVWYATVGMNVGAIAGGLGFLAGGVFLFTLRGMPLYVALGYLPGAVGLISLAIRSAKDRNWFSMSLLAGVGVLVMAAGVGRLIYGDFRIFAQIGGAAALITGISAMRVRRPLLSRSRSLAWVILVQALVIAAVGGFEGSSHDFVRGIDGFQIAAGVTALLLATAGGAIYSRSLIRYLHRFHGAE